MIKIRFKCRGCRVDYFRPVTEVDLFYSLSEKVIKLVERRVCCHAFSEIDIPTRMGLNQGLCMIIAYANELWFNVYFWSEKTLKIVMFVITPVSRINLGWISMKNMKAGSLTYHMYTHPKYNDIYLP